MGEHIPREAGPYSGVPVLGIGRGRTGNLVPHLDFIFQSLNHVKESGVVECNRLTLKVEFQETAGFRLWGPHKSGRDPYVINGQFRRTKKRR